MLVVNVILTTWCSDGDFPTEDFHFISAYPCWAYQTHVADCFPLRSKQAANADVTPLQSEYLSMGNEFYRFRRISSLIGEFEELKNQSIYFAEPEALNDPMEGFRDMYWSGDYIVEKFI